MAHPLNTVLRRLLTSWERVHGRPHSNPPYPYADINSEKNSISIRHISCALVPTFNRGSVVVEQCCVHVPTVRHLILLNNSYTWAHTIPHHIFPALLHPTFLPPSRPTASGRTCVTSVVADNLPLSADLHSCIIYNLRYDHYLPPFCLASVLCASMTFPFTTVVLPVPTASHNFPPSIPHSSGRTQYSLNYSSTLPPRPVTSSRYDRWLHITTRYLLTANALFECCQLCRPDACGRSAYAAPPQGRQCHTAGSALSGFTRGFNVAIHTTCCYFYSSLGLSAKRRRRSPLPLVMLAIFLRNAPYIFSFLCTIFHLLIPSTHPLLDPPPALLLDPRSQLMRLSPIAVIACLPACPSPHCLYDHCAAV